MQIRDWKKGKCFVVTGDEVQAVTGKPKRRFSYATQPKRVVEERALAWADECRIQARERSSWTARDDAPLFGTPEQVGTLCYNFIEYEYSRTLPSIGRLSRQEVGAKAVALRQIANLKLDGKLMRDTRIDQIPRSLVIRDLVPAVAKMGARSTVRKKLLYAKQALAYAIECDLIEKNPCDIKASFTSAPDNTANKDFDDLDVRVPAIIKCADAEFQTIIMFAAYTGLRAGEQRALTWDDLDLKAMKVRVDKAVKKSGEIGPPKSRFANRQVDVPAEMVPILLRWKMQQAPSKGRSLDLVFPAADGGVADLDRWRRQGLHKAAKRAGVQACNWHQLRHHFASCLIFKSKQLVSPQEICRLMGHHDFSFTLRQYGHWFDKVRQDSAAGAAISQIMEDQHYA